jgi:hypothetical protein
MLIKYNIVQVYAFFDFSRHSQSKKLDKKILTELHLGFSFCVVYTKTKAKDQVSRTHMNTKHILSLFCIFHIANLPCTMPCSSFIRPIALPKQYRKAKHENCDKSQPLRKFALVQTNKTDRRYQFRDENVSSHTERF